MTNKEVVAAMYKEFFNAHDISAAEKYVKEDYIQHNPKVPQGRAGLMEGFTQKFKDEPTFHLEILQMIGEDDKVVVHLQNVAPDGHIKANVVDIYRLEDGMLAEHWDVIQAL